MKVARHADSDDGGRVGRGKVPSRAQAVSAEGSLPGFRQHARKLVFVSSTVSSLSNTPGCMLLLISKIFNIPKHQLANMEKGVTPGWKFGVCQQTIPQLPLKKQHPILTELPTALGVFDYEFLQKQLGLTQEDSPTIAQATVVPVQHKIGRS